MVIEMLKFHLDKNDYEKVAELLPELFPEIKIQLEMCDENLVNLGFCQFAPCIVTLNISQEKFKDIIDELIDIETDAFDTKYGNYPKDEDPIYQKFLKYGCLYNILNNVEITAE